jgi:hypothetical protein
MYEQPTIADSLVIGEEINEPSFDEGTKDINDPIKTKLQEDEEQKITSNKLILRWGLVFTFFR